MYGPDAGAVEYLLAAGCAWGSNEGRTVIMI